VVRDADGVLVLGSEAPSRATSGWAVEPWPSPEVKEAVGRGEEDGTLRGSAGSSWTEERAEVEGVEVTGARKRLDEQRH
jgi:hypothetical protein